ncbi:BPSL0761 family protein [Paraburkholderia fungorum]|uniref:BPSL0761 family protein n=1 Tax=Paraburkholderia fungorum TaxID=134537 RepID=UPI0038BBAC40
MTLPLERTRAVLDAREFLADLAPAPEEVNVDLFRRRAHMLLRRFPGHVHLQLSAAMAPGIWGEPEERLRE